MKDRFRRSVLPTSITTMVAILLSTVPAANAQTLTVQWGAFGDIPVPGRYLATSRRTDLAVYRPSTGQWHVRSRSGSVHVEQWGRPGDIPTPGDYDGDGFSDFAVWRPSNGTWWVKNSRTGSVRSQQFGIYGDIPVQSDYSGDRRVDYAIWRPRNGAWYVMNSVTGEVHVRQWGLYGDLPVPGRLSGFGLGAAFGEDYTVWRQRVGPLNGPSSATWYTAKLDGLLTRETLFGEVGDIPFKALLNSAVCGSVEIAVFRPATGEWWTEAGLATKWGRIGDVPVAADYLDTPSADFAVWRPSNGTWYVKNNPSICLN
jgi:hypothetical protein